MSPQPIPKTIEALALKITREHAERQSPTVTIGLVTERTLNRALAQGRPPVERGVARLKSWRIFRRSRCSPNRMTDIAAAVLTLERQR